MESGCGLSLLINSESCKDGLRSVLCILRHFVEAGHRLEHVMGSKEMSTLKGICQ